MAAGRVTAQRIIEDIDVFEYMLCRFFTVCVPSMIDKLPLECFENTFDTGGLSQQYPLRKKWIGPFGINDSLSNMMRGIIRG